MAGSILHCDYFYKQTHVYKNGSGHSTDAAGLMLHLWRHRPQDVPLPLELNNVSEHGYIKCLRS